jgi:hypothetical protein
MTGIGASFSTEADHMTSASDLIGTWRVSAFQLWGAGGEERHPIGREPVGYAIFDAAGRFFFQLSKSRAEAASAEEVAGSFMAYFGRFTVSGDTLILAAESGNGPDDVGTTQTRSITLDGDRLTIGVPGRFQAALRREAMS